MGFCHWLLTAVFGNFICKRYRQENPDYIKTYLLCCPVNPLTLICFYSLLTLLFYFTIINVFGQFSLCAKYLLIIGMLEISLKIACLYMMAVGLIKQKSYLLGPQIVIYYSLSLASLITCLLALSFYFFDCQELMSYLFCMKTVDSCESLSSALWTFCGMFYFYQAAKVLSKVYFNLRDWEDARFDVDDIVVVAFKNDGDVLADPAVV